MAAGARITVYGAQAIQEAYHLSTPARVHIAQEAAALARGTAAVLTGAYRGGIGVEVAGDVVRLVDTDPDAGYKEYGTSDTPAHAALTNAARQFGRYSGYRPR